MNSAPDQEISMAFISFVGSNYSRSSTLLNFKSQGIEKTYIYVPEKFLKNLKSVFKNKTNLNKYDFLVVMSPCHMLTPVLKLITKKPVILDAGWSLTDGILSRGLKFRNMYKLPLIFALDLISMHSANLVLVESKLQRNRVQRIFALPLEKVHVSYTGLDESQFRKALEAPQSETGLISELRKDIDEKEKTLVVLFRGKVNRESGFKNICDAARILSKEATFIFILGEQDVLPSDLQNAIRISNVSPIEMMEIYGLADIAVGQISDHPRLKYTIPHKAFEAGYFRKAYVTSGSNGIREIYNEESAFYLSETNPESLANAILNLANDEIRKMLEVEIGLHYQNSFSQEVINKNFAQLIRDNAGQTS